MGRLPEAKPPFKMRVLPKYTLFDCLLGMMEVAGLTSKI